MKKNKKIEYCQCQLRRGNSEIVSWIPKQYGKVGQYIKLKNRETKEWTDGWFVVSAGSLLLDHSTIIDRENDHKHARKASDI